MNTFPIKDNEITHVEVTYYDHNAECFDIFFPSIEILVSEMIEECIYHVSASPSCCFLQDGVITIVNCNVEEETQLYELMCEGISPRDALKLMKL